MLKTCLSGGGAIGEKLAGHVARAKQWNLRLETSMLDDATYYDIPRVLHNQKLNNDTRSVNLAWQAVLATSDGYPVLSYAPGKQLSATIDAVGHPEWREGIERIFDRNVLTHTFCQRIAQPPKQTIALSRPPAGLRKSDGELPWSGP
jgi:hypothetical protein